MVAQGLAAHAAATDLLMKAGPIAEAARQSGAMVIYAQLAFRPGHPEIGGGASSSFLRMNASGLLIEYTWGAGTPDEVAPKDGDIILIKRRVSCFAGTDLELILRAQAVQEIVLLGGATYFVVEATARDETDLGFEVTVVSDACAAFIQGAHEASEEARSSFVALCTAAEVLLASRCERRPERPNLAAGDVETGLRLLDED